MTVFPVWRNSLCEFDFRVARDIRPDGSHSTRMVLLILCKSNDISFSSKQYSSSLILLISYVRNCHIFAHNCLSFCQLIYIFCHIYIFYFLHFVSLQYHLLNNRFFYIDISNVMSNFQLKFALLKMLA